MGSSTGGATANDSMAELFGSPGRRPLLSNTLRTLAGIFSHFPDENPFAKMADFNFTPAVWEAINAAPRKSLLRPTSDGGGNDHTTRSEKEASVELGDPGSGAVENLPTHNSEKSDVETAGVLCKDNGVNVTDTMIDELNAGRETETVDKDASHHDTNNKSSEVHDVTQGLLGIEKMLMDESDEVGLLEMSDQDVNFDLLKDLDSFTATDGFGDNPVPVESNGNDKLTVEGTSKLDVVVENKGESVEVANSTSGGNAGQCHAHVPMQREKAENSVVGNLSVDASTKDIEWNKRTISQNNPMPADGNDKLPVVVESKGKSVEVMNATSGGNAGKCHALVPMYREKADSSKVGNLSVDASPKDVEGKRKKVSQNVPQIGGLSEGGANSGGKSVDPIKKGHKSRAIEKDKSKKTKKAKEDVKSRKRKHESVDSGGSNTKKSRGGNSVGNKKALEENVDVNEENLSVKSAGKSSFTKGERLQYTRVQLMHLRQAAVPEDMVKVVKDLSVQLLGGEKSSTVEEATNASSKGQLGSSTEKNAEDMDSGVLKKRKRGTSSEARKERKKAKKKKKRAEENKKLGVKRLKLRPVLKPKVVQPCRHYLRGRCQEAEKCKFSHDVVPLTKSKACRHFARHACMKGDDCPFDHELSKYPCDNIAETGFCGRGDSCLFSHQIPAKDATKTAVSVSKSQTCPLSQPDKSKSTQQLIPTASPSAPKKLKENLAAQIGRPTKTLKGVSFLSFGKSSPDISGKVAGVTATATATSQPNVDAARTSGQPPNLAVSSSSDNPLTSLPSPTPQRYSFDGCGTKNQASENNARIGGQTYQAVSAGAIGLKKSFMIYPASPTPESSFPPLERSSVDKVVTNGRANVDGAGTSTQSNQTVTVTTTVAPRGASFVSLEKTSGDTPFMKPPLHDSANKGQVDSASGQKLQASGPSTTDGRSVSLTENRVSKGSEKLKAVDSDVPVSTSTPSQCSIRAAGSVNSSPGTAKRAILSTLAFAARFESRIKMSADEAKKNEGASGSGSKQKEPTIKASDLLERLYGGSRK